MEDSDDDDVVEVVTVRAAPAAPPKRARSSACLSKVGCMHTVSPPLKPPLSPAKASVHCKTVAVHRATLVLNADFFSRFPFTGRVGRQLVSSLGIFVPQRGGTASELVMCWRPRLRPPFGRVASTSALGRAAGPTSPAVRSSCSSSQSAPVSPSPGTSTCCSRGDPPRRSALLAAAPGSSLSTSPVAQRRSLGHEEFGLRKCLDELR
jgi:hypothetical protein